MGDTKVAKHCLALPDNEPPLTCIQGFQLLRQAVPDAPQAEACFHQALDMARQQEAKSWELRAATSLTRLWQQQGKYSEAHELLTPVYGWFSEGFDTADLIDARALLEALEKSRAGTSHAGTRLDV